MEPADAAFAAPRGLLRVGGATLARHQLTLALAAGCTRIACLARGIGPDLIALQHEAERAGASFHVVASSHGLSGLVTAADDMLVMAEGLMASTDEALSLIDGLPAVLIQPAEIGIPAGFERIDLNSAWAGLMIVPGRLVDRLMDLPADSEPSSALLRIALQAGVVQRPVPDKNFSSGRWMLVRTEQEAHSAEDGWVARHTNAGPRTPGPMLARALVRQFGPALLHGGNSSLIGAGTAVLLAALGMGTTWFGWATLGLALTGLGWVLRQVSASLDRLRREALALRPVSGFQELAFEIAFDLVFIAVLIVAIPALPGQLAIGRSFAPVMLIGLLRLLAQGAQDGWRIWAADRMVVAVVLCGLSLGHVLEPGVPLAAALLLLAGLILPRHSDADGLTRA